MRRERTDRKERALHTLSLQTTVGVRDTVREGRRTLEGDVPRMSKRKNPHREIKCPLCNNLFPEEDTCEVETGSGYIMTICLYCDKMRKEKQQ